MEANSTDGYRHFLRLYLAKKRINEQRKPITIFGREPNYGTLNLVPNYPQQVWPVEMIKPMTTEEDPEYLMRREVYRMRAGYSRGQRTTQP